MFSQSNFLRADQRQRHQNQVLDSSTKSFPPHQRSYASSLPRPSLKGWQRLVSFYQQFFKRLGLRSQISIEERISDRGQAYWYVTNPAAGQSFYAETVNEAIHWIEVQHLGK